MRLFIIDLILVSLVCLMLSCEPLNFWRKSKSHRIVIAFVHVCVFGGGVWFFWHSNGIPLSNDFWRMIFLSFIISHEHTMNTNIYRVKLYFDIGHVTVWHMFIVLMLSHLDSIIQTSRHLACSIFMPPTYWRSFSFWLGYGNKLCRADLLLSDVINIIQLASLFLIVNIDVNIV